MESVLVRVRFPQWAFRLTISILTALVLEGVTNVSMRCDVRQGYPASGCLFASAVDRVLCVLAHGPGPRGAACLRRRYHVDFALSVCTSSSQEVWHCLESGRKSLASACKFRNAKWCRWSTGACMSSCGRWSKWWAAQPTRALALPRAASVSFSGPAPGSHSGTLWLGKTIRRTADVVATAWGLAGLTMFRAHS